MIAPRWILRLHARWAICPAIGLAGCLCACAPANRTVMEARVVPVAVPALEYADETPRHYGSSTAPRIVRHRPIEKRQRQHREVQQAGAEWVNPPFEAGE